MIRVRGTFIVRSAALMTAFSLVNKLLGVFLRLYVSARIGSEGMGLYQLILGVYSMFSTFATAGFTVSVSRLAAEKDERSPGDVKLLMKNAFIASAVIGAAATGAMLVFAGKIASGFLNDARCAAPLRVLALSMPFMAAAACFKGWFIAKRKAIVTSAASLFEQVIKIAVIALCLGVFMANATDINELCLGIVFGVTVSEAGSCGFLLVSRLIAGRKSRNTSPPPTESASAIRRSLFAVTAPISLSICVTSLLHTAETVLVPKVFEKFSGDRAYALSQFGMIRGMVIPILFFPFAFLSSLISVFTPEISRLNLLYDKTKRNAAIASMTSAASVIAIAAGGLFFAIPEAIGEAFYPGENTAGAIRMLAAVTPFMYVETVCDGILKAVGEQNRTLIYTLVNSAVRIILTLTLVAHRGGEGYLILLIISNCFSYLLCRARLAKVAGVLPKPRTDVIVPLIAAAAGGFAANRAVYAFLTPGSAAVSAAVGTAVYCVTFGATAMVLAGKKIIAYLAALRKRAYGV